MFDLRVLGSIGMIVAILFAGCVEQADSLSPPPQVSSGPAAFDEVTGGIEGTITDSELVPIGGALVGILPSDALPQGMNAISAENGAFTFSHVPPGTHTIAASALGYGSTSKPVDVQAGAITSVAFIVDQLASQDPYSETQVLTGTAGGFNYRVTPQCMYLSGQIPVQTQYNTLVKTCGGIAGGDFGQPHFVDEFQKELDWRTIVAELSWQPQSTVTGRGLSMDLNAPNSTRGTGGSIDQASPYTFDKESGKPPLIIRVDLPETLVERGIPESDWYSWPDGEGCTAPTAGAANCDWFIRLFAAPCDLSANVGGCGVTPVDFGAPQDMPVTLYFSYFYKAQADPAFTALPDA